MHICDKKIYIIVYIIKYKYLYKCLCRYTLRSYKNYERYVIIAQKYILYFGYNR